MISAGGWFGVFIVMFRREIFHAKTQGIRKGRLKCCTRRIIPAIAFRFVSRGVAGEERRALFVFGVGSIQELGFYFSHRHGYVTGGDATR